MPQVLNTDSYSGGTFATNVAPGYTPPRVIEYQGLTKFDPEVHTAFPCWPSDGKPLTQSEIEQIEYEKREARKDALANDDVKMAGWNRLFTLYDEIDSAGITVDTTSIATVRDSIESASISDTKKALWGGRIISEWENIVAIYNSPQGAIADRRLALEIYQNV